MWWAVPTLHFYGRRLSLCRCYDCCYNRWMQRINYRVRKTTLADHSSTNDVASLTPGERMAMAWEITKDAWAFMGKPVDESRLQRDVIRVYRRAR